MFIEISSEWPLLCRTNAQYNTLTAIAKRNYFTQNFVQLFTCFIAIVRRLVPVLCLFVLNGSSCDLAR